MSWGHVRANWKQAQRYVQHRWDRLSDDDISRIRGHRDTLIECLQERYGYSREQALQQVRNWEHDF